MDTLPRSGSPLGLLRAERHWRYILLRNLALVSAMPPPSRLGRSAC